MRRYFAKMRGLGYLMWHARHDFYHILLGLVWAWFLRERWGEFNARWIWLAVLGSLLPDADHLLYFFTYGRHDEYSRQIKEFFKNREWRIAWTLIEKGHKYQTNLASHNIYFMLILLVTGLTSSFFEWRSGVVLSGAMVLHYMFDIFDDVLTLGYINPNWKRWGRAKKEVDQLVSSDPVPTKL